MIRLFASMVLVLLCNMVSAKSIYEAQNGDTINATIAANDLTRIEISGQKIIKDFSTANISKKITKPLGQVYLIPNTKTTFNLYLVSNLGNTYNLRLTPSKNSTGDSIIIKPAISPKVHRSQESMPTTSYVRNINYLLEVMYLNKEDSQYSTSDVNQAIITYKNLDSVLLRKFTNDSLTGYVILLKNTSKDKIILSEAEFYSPHTLAIAIDEPTLLSNAFTLVFIVKDE